MTDEQVWDALAGKLHPGNKPGNKTGVDAPELDEKQTAAIVQHIMDIANTRRCDDSYKIALILMKNVADAKDGPTAVAVIEDALACAMLVQVGILFPQVEDIVRAVCLAIELSQELSGE